MSSIFHATSKHVAKSAGSNSLHAVMDLNTAERFKPLSIVKRKRSFWFWKKPQMIPTQITMQDIILKKINLPVDAKSFTLMEKFTEKPMFEVDGKIGAKICSELNLQVSGSDKVHLSMEVGDIIKTEINWQVLNEFLQNNPVDISHQLLNDVQKSSRTTLCVVLEALSTKAEGKLEEDDDVKIQTDDTLPVQKSVVKVDIQGSGSVEKVTALSFTIPPDTVLAYSCNEFSIDENGITSLHATMERLDDSNEPLFTKQPNVNDPIVHVTSELAPLMKAEHFERFRKELKLLLEDMTNEALQAMFLLLSTAELVAEKKSEDNSMTISSLQHLFGGAPRKAWKDLLLMLGFLLPEDTTNENAVIQFPSDEYKPLIKPCIGIIEALLENASCLNPRLVLIAILTVLTDISSTSRNLLSTISANHANVLLNIVKRQIHSEDVSRKEQEISTMFQTNPSTEMFLKQIGFIEMRADDDELICHANVSSAVLLDVFTILYVLAQD